MGALTVKQPHSFETKRGLGDIFWNFLAILVLVGIIAMGGCFITGYASPHFGLNPIASAAAGNPIATLRATNTVDLPTLTVGIATRITPMPAAPSRATELQPVAAATKARAEPTPTFEPTAAPLGKAATFILRNELAAISSKVIHPELECQWAGVGGQVFDLQGRPLVQINLRLKGVLDGHPVDLLGLTGTQLEYGPAGYEFTLGDQPVASKGSLTLQLVDPNGLPLSDQVAIDPSADCDSNLVLVNFKQIR